VRWETLGLNNSKHHSKDCQTTCILHRKHLLLEKARATCLPAGL
jgi:hypothetical protein